MYNGGGADIYYTENTNRPFRRILVQTREGKLKSKSIFLDSKRYLKYGHLYNFGSDNLSPLVRQEKRKPFTQGQLDYQNYFGEHRHLKMNPKVFGPEYVDAQLIKRKKKRLDKLGFYETTQTDIKPMKKDLIMTNNISYDYPPIRSLPHIVEKVKLEIERETYETQERQNLIDYEIREGKKDLDEFNKMMKRNISEGLARAAERRFEKKKQERIEERNRLENRFPYLKI